MMPTLNDKDAALLPKILGRLGSDHEGEILAAVRRAKMVLDRNKMGWSDLLRQSGGTGGGDYDAGYRAGVSAGIKAAQKAQAEADRQREKEKPKAATGSSRHWPPDDDIWNGYDPMDGAAEYAEQIDQLNALWKVETRLTDFEHNFVQSLAEQLVEKGRLTDRQCEVLDEIHDRRIVNVRVRR
jgi:hypothetical protein